jgi:hypothetical protein
MRRTCAIKEKRQKANVASPRKGLHLCQDAALQILNVAKTYTGFLFFKQLILCKPSFSSTVMRLLIGRIILLLRDHS